MADERRRPGGDGNGLMHHVHLVAGDQFSYHLPLHELIDQHHRGAKCCVPLRGGVKTDSVARSVCGTNGRVCIECAAGRLGKGAPVHLWFGRELQATLPLPGRAGGSSSAGAAMLRLQIESWRAPPQCTLAGLLGKLRSSDYCNAPLGNTL